MSNFKYKDFVDAMEDLAKKHKEILHDQFENPASNVKRVAFYRANNEEEVRQDHGGLQVWYPYMILVRPYSKYESDGVINRVSYNGFEIRKKVSTATAYDEIDQVREDCQRIAEEILGYINLLAEEDLSESVFYAFDINNVQGDFTGPVHTDEYGYRVTWANKQDGWSPFQYDPTDFFNL